MNPLEVYWDILRNPPVATFLVTFVLVALVIYCREMLR